MLKNIIYIFSAVLFASCTKLTNTSSIKVVGEMRGVMWKGDLKGKIATDSLNNKGKAVSYLGQFARYWTAKVAYNAYQKFAFV